MSELHDTSAEIYAACAVEIAKLQAQVEALKAALAELEQANEVVCAGRSQGVYNLMMLDGQSDALLALDVARRRARSALENQQEATGAPKAASATRVEGTSE